MGRKLIIVTTLLGLLIGSVGLPTNVHACNMAKEEKVAKSCGMCDKSHESQEEGKGCCHNRVELHHTDHASLVKAKVEISPPLLLAVLTWSFIRTEALPNSHYLSFVGDHPPPLERRRQSAYLFNSSFLI